MLAPLYILCGHILPTKWQDAEQINSIATEKNINLLSGHLEPLKCKMMQSATNEIIIPAEVPTIRPIRKWFSIGAVISPKKHDVSMIYSFRTTAMMFYKATC